jgi:hypothetical protein
MWAKCGFWSIGSREFVVQHPAFVVLLERDFKLAVLRTCRWIHGGLQKTKCADWAPSTSKHPNSAISQSQSCACETNYSKILPVLLCMMMLIHGIARIPFSLGGLKLIVNNKRFAKVEWSTRSVMLVKSQFTASVTVITGMSECSMLNKATSLLITFWRVYKTLVHWSILLIEDSAFLGVQCETLDSCPSSHEAWLLQNMLLRNEFSHPWLRHCSRPTWRAGSERLTASYLTFGCTYASELYVIQPKTKHFWKKALEMYRISSRRKA